MLRDAEYFRSRLSKLDGAGDIGDMIVGIVEGKSIERTEDAKADAAGRNPTEGTVGANEERSPREGVSPANDSTSAIGDAGK
jgi:vacuolar protein sorting-associated protein 54